MEKYRILPAFQYESHNGDFLSLLKSHGWQQAPTNLMPGQHNGLSRHELTEGTTILAIKYRDGVLVAGDRRATAGNLLVYDRADKVLQIDDSSVMAIAGSPATAWEMARVLQHSLKYYRRSQLQEMSLSGKVRALSKLLKENLPMTIQGIGAVVPLFATFAEGEGKVYFYDVLGAQFEAVDYATSGSGSPAVRSVAYYLNTWGTKPLVKLTREEVLTVALRLLDTAAEGDTATGGYNRRGNIFPIVKLLTKDGVQSVPDSNLARMYKQKV